MTNVPWLGRLRQLVYLPFAFLCVGPVSAQIYVDAPQAELTPPEDIVPGLNYFARSQVSIDDNLYRLPDGYANAVSGIGAISRTDRITEVSVGADESWINTLQYVAIHARVNHDSYSNNSYLDNTSGAGNVAWNWSLAHHWTGQFRADYSRALVNFENTRLLVEDLLDTSSYLASVRYQVGPSWALLAEARRAETHHSQAVEKSQDSDLDSGAFGLEYATSANNTVELQYSYSKAQFPDEFVIPGSQAGNFHEALGRLLLQYEASDKTVVNANAGYLTRNYIGSLEKYSGDVWHASVRWVPALKVQVTVLASRDLTAYTSAASEYFIDEGLSVNAAWSPRDKFKVLLTASRDDQNYIPGAENFLINIKRRDRVGSEQASATYLPRDWLEFDLSLRWEQRDSNVATFAYTDRVIGAAFRVIL